MKPKYHVITSYSIHYTKLYDNSTFNPSYCEPELSITGQIDTGISFFREKYRTQEYLAYFQAYSNTYGETQEILKKYKEALDHPKVTGIVIGTRPDCISDSLLEVLKEWNEQHYIAIELGVESTNNETLGNINRGHGYAETLDAVKRISECGIPVGMHLILGLPGENRELLLQHAKEVSRLPISFLKLHQLQIVKGSQFATDYENT